MSRACRCQIRGTTLIEVMMALAITATLLLAIGSSLYTLLRAHRINEAHTITMNKARLVLNSMLHRMRMTGAHQPNDARLLDRFKTNDRQPQTVNGQVVDGGILDTTGVAMSIQVARGLDDSSGGDPQKIGQLDFTYEYDARRKRLTLKAQGGPKQVLMQNVTDFQVRFYPTRSADALANGMPCDIVEQITVKMTVEPSVGDLSSEGGASQSAITLFGSVVPRVNTWTGRHTPYTIEELSGTTHGPPQPGF